MLRLIFIAWLALCGVANAQLSGGVGGFPGPGTAHSSVTYTGPGDTFTTSPYAAYSCAEAFTAAYATSLGNLCDLVDSAAPTTVICTLKSLATGKADLASASCTGGVTPAVKCAAATGGVCNISKAYDQTGSARDAVQTTAASQPTLTFSSTPTGTLPAINCSGGTNAFLQTAGSLTQAQPFTNFAVYNRNGTVQLGGILGETSGGDLFIAGGSSANTVSVVAPTGLTSGTTATDSTWLAVSTLLSGASSAINIMAGTETTGNAGTNGLSTNLRLCRAGGSQFLGLLSEVQIWAATSNNTDRNNLVTNARTSGRYNF